MMRRSSSSGSDNLAPDLPLPVPLSFLESSILPASLQRGGPTSCQQPLHQSSPPTAAFPLTQMSWEGAVLVRTLKH